MKIRKHYPVYFFLFIWVIFCLVGCSNRSQDKQTYSAELNVRHLGRTFTQDNVIWCCNSGTGIEFEYSGTALDITVYGDEAASMDERFRARIGIYVDDNLVIDSLIDSDSMTFPILNSAEETNIVVRIVKLSEGRHSSFGIAPIDLSNGAHINPTPTKTHTIEFIGDSITCGYGDEGVLGEGFETATENVTGTYAYKTAQAFDADYSFFAVSGWGIISGSSDVDEKNDNWLIPKIYDSLGYAQHPIATGLLPQDIPWDFNRIQPELIVIHLGTNDLDYLNDKPERYEEFVDGYVDFLKTVRLRNPESAIICTIGLMWDELYPTIEEAVARFRESTLDTNIYSVVMPTHDGTYGLGCAWHPTSGSHSVGADILIDFIRETLHW